MEEEVGFEPTVRSHVRRFSRPLQSTALALLQTIVCRTYILPTQYQLSSRHLVFTLTILILNLNDIIYTTVVLKENKMSEINFQVDKNKCIHCGLCEKDCIAQIIHLNSDKHPSISQEDESRCIKCQHCLAICPAGAISILGKNPENSENCNNFPESDKMLNLIKSRKSFRHYKHENLSPEIMQKLKDMFKYSPTGCNFHKLHISIIDDIEVMDRFRNRTNNKIKSLFLTRTFNAITKKFEKYKSAFLNGDDVIFRKAPHMIVVSVPINAPCANEDPIIALSYFELYAQSLGVGTLWCGFAQICLKVFPDLCAFLEIPDGYKPGYVMLFGPTDIKYARTAQPEEITITSVKGNKNIDNMSGFDKLKRYFWNTIR